MNRMTQRGFTFVELAMVMIIVGLLLAGLTQTLYVYNIKEARTKTNNAVEVSRDAMMEIVARNGAYLCPADPRLGPNDPNYGVPNCGAAGIVRVYGRDANGDGDADSVVIGSLPVRQMNFPLILNTKYDDTLSVDAWDNKITYAVTESLTNPVTYQHRNGIIDVVDEFDQNVLEVAGTAHAIFISHGQNGIGAYPLAGGNRNPGCASSSTPGPPGGPVTAWVDERENCDDNDVKFLSGLRSENANTYNDDTVIFFINQAGSLWTYVGTNLVVNTNPGFVGIGVQSPTQKLHVGGDLRADSVTVDDLCNGNSADCMPIETLAGAGIACPNPNEAVVSIENNSVTECVPLLTATPTGGCPPGRAAVGFTQAGVLLCEPIP